jgi:hypothetical protein
MFEVKDFEFFREQILQLDTNYQSSYEFKDYLKNTENYTLDLKQDILEFHNDPNDEYWDTFKECVEELLYDGVVETTYDIDDDHVRIYKRVSKVGEKYFYSEYDPHYGHTDEIQEVFPEKVTVQAFKFPSGFLTNDELDIIE